MSLPSSSIPFWPIWQFPQLSPPTLSTPSLLIYSLFFKCRIWLFFRFAPRFEGHQLWCIFQRGLDLERGGADKSAHLQKHTGGLFCVWDWSACSASVVVEVVVLCHAQFVQAPERKWILNLRFLKYNWLKSYRDLISHPWFLFCSQLKISSEIFCFDNIFNVIMLVFPFNNNTWWWLFNCEYESLISHMFSCTSHSLCLYLHLSHLGFNNYIIHI